MRLLPTLFCGVAVALSLLSAPVAVADEASVLVDSSVDVNVLANDTDVDGDALTVNQAISSFGTVTILADQQLSYTPNPDFVGTDTVIYSITDGKGGTASSELVVDVFSNSRMPLYKFGDLIFLEKIKKAGWLLCFMVSIAIEYYLIVTRRAPDM